MAALQVYGAGATAVLDSTNDQNGTITYGFTVTAGGAAGAKSDILGGGNTQQ